jgi:Domain of unknown function (DUF4055)
MPITSQHPTYVEFIKQWTRCRDAFDGQDAVKSKGAAYLPYLTKQSDSDYRAYKDRALFFSITAKTVSALVGMAMVRTPVIAMPVAMKRYFEDDQGIQFYEILSQTLSENLLMGRVGVLADRPAAGGDPYACVYTTESIINWDLDDLGFPTMIMLHESYAKVGPDKYEKVVEDRYRELSLNNGTYVQTVYDKLGTVIESFAPTNDGQTMDYIPFTMFTPYGIGFDIKKSPMLDIVDINLSHYRTSADLEHGRHFTALPTPVVSGAETTKELRVGSQTAWVLPDSNARAWFLEFTGQGLQSLEKALQEKQGQLASMSARLLDNSKRGSEAADTVRLRYASETASLAMVVRATEAGLTKMYRIIAKMKGEDENSVQITLNKEFLDARMDSTAVVDLVQSYIDGGISAETLVFNLRRGDILAVDRNDDVEVAALEKEKARKESMSAKKPISSNTMQ